MNNFNNLFIGIVAIIVALAVLCIQAIIEQTPLWAVIGLVLACFVFGFILGENHE
jgi:hypothetical protein